MTKTKMKAERGIYTAVYEPAGEAGWWTVTIAEVPGCISQGRGIAQARARVREALGLFVDGAEHVELRDEYRLARAVQRAVDLYRKRRADAERVATAASASSRDAVRALVHGRALSTRDAGEILGVSQARVAQLANEIADEPRDDKQERRHSGARDATRLRSRTHQRMR